MHAHRTLLLAPLTILALVAGSAPTARAQFNSLSTTTQQQLNVLNTQATGAGYDVTSYNNLTLGPDRNPISDITGLGTVSSLGTAPRRPQPTFTSRPALFGNGRGPTTKPFANAQRDPTVSPYLNLFRDDFDGFGDLNYNTLVRPQLQQQQLNQDFARQAAAINQRVQQIAAQPAFSPEGSKDQLPTGHSTVFRNMSHYYPVRQTRR